MIKYLKEKGIKEYLIVETENTRYTLVVEKEKVRVDYKNLQDCQLVSIETAFDMIGLEKALLRMLIQED